MNLNILAAIMIGGSIGAALRHMLSFTIANNNNSSFPWGTFAVNIIGSFIIGVLWQFFNDYEIPAHIRAILITGGLGAFTTFSTYSLDTVILLQNGQVKMGLMNTAVNATLGIIAVWVGITAARHALPQ